MGPWVRGDKARGRLRGNLCGIDTTTTAQAIIATKPRIMISSTRQVSGDECPAKKVNAIQL